MTRPWPVSGILLHPPHPLSQALVSLGSARHRSDLRTLDPTVTSLGVQKGSDASKMEDRRLDEPLLWPFSPSAVDDRRRGGWGTAASSVVVMPGLGPLTIPGGRRFKANTRGEEGLEEKEWSAL
jgi:hypothetical protein